MNMKLQNQMVIVNGALLGGLAFQHLLGAPMLVLAGCGTLLFLFVNVIFFVSFRRSKNLR